MSYFLHHAALAFLPNFWMVKLMASMKSIKQHEKILLSGTDDCAVLYCPDCNVPELIIGGLTLKISTESLRTLSAVLNHAKVRLDQVQNISPDKGNVRPANLKRVH